MDKRHIRRTEIVQNLFAYSYQKNTDRLPFNQPLTLSIIESIDRIDGIIVSHASKFPIEKISKIDLSILRLAIYELMISRQEPAKVVVNEAVELAKELGGDKSYSFINGVLGTLIKEHER